MAEHDQIRQRTRRLHAVTVDPARNQIRGDGGVVQLEPKVMDVLCALLEQPGEVLSREDLISRVWGLEFGSDESVTRAVSLLRRAFRDADSEREYVETIPKRGYRIIADGAPAAPEVVTPAPAPQAPRPSIAVLAFADMSPGGEQEHFSDGVSEEIINALIRVPQLRVIGRTSSFAFKSKGETIPSIAAALNVSHVLQGSVRKHGHRLRIAAQLLEAASERHIWSQTFDGGYEDVFDLQEKIANAAAASLRALFSSDTAALPRLASKLTSSQEAYDLFLRGRSLSARIHGDGVLQQAVACLERAVLLDTSFAEAWAELANAYSHISIYNAIDDRHGLVVRSFNAAARAIDLRPDYGFPRTVQAFCRLASNDIPGALRLAKEGMRLDPESPDSIWRYGYCLAVIGRIKDAMPHLQAAAELDPLQGRNLGILAQAYLCAGDIDQAETYARRALQLGYHGAVHMYATAAYARGDNQLAIERLLAESAAFSELFWPEFTTPDLWRLAANGLYSGKTEDRELIVRGLKAVAQMTGRKNELSLLGGLMLTGSAADFFEAYGPQPYPGASLMLLSLWTNIEPPCTVRDDPGFPAFASRIGLAAAWEEYGRPDVWEQNAPR
jgi:TolB-like protein